MAIERTMEGGPRAYRPTDGFFDELFDADGAPAAPRRRARRGARARSAPSSSPPPGAAATRSSCSRGSRSRRPARTARRASRPFPLDLVPRILPASEWTHIKRGLAQRIRALNHFVDDVYHAREIVRDGIVPWRLVVSRAPLRPRRARDPAAGRRLLPRRRLRPRARRGRHAGRCSRTTSARRRGISYVLENRVAMARLCPQLFAPTACARSTTTRSCCSPRCARSRRRPTARRRSSSGRPGPLNSAYFEHAFLARQMGVELVEASDLVVRDDVLYMRTTRGLARVHAVYRRLDDDFVDPLEFRPDSLLGVPGPRARLPRRHGRDGQRVRHRGRRRQGRLPLRPGDDPLLPRRGAAALERPDLPDRRPRAARARARAGSTSSSSSRRASPAARASSSGRDAGDEELAGLARRRSAPTRSAGSPRTSSSSRPCRPPGTTAGSRRATSTCARSPSSASDITSSPAA